MACTVTVNGKKRHCTCKYQIRNRKDPCYECCRKGTGAGGDRSGGGAASGGGGNQPSGGPRPGGGGGGGGGGGDRPGVRGGAGGKYNVLFPGGAGLAFRNVPVHAGLDSYWDNLSHLIELDMGSSVPEPPAIAPGDIPGRAVSHAPPKKLSAERSPFGGRRLSTGASIALPWPCQKAHYNQALCERAMRELNERLGSRRPLV